MSGSSNFTKACPNGAISKRNKDMNELEQKIIDAAMRRLSKWEKENGSLDLKPPEDGGLPAGCEARALIEACIEYKKSQQSLLEPA